MKYALLIACSALATQVAYGQKTEFSVHLTSGGLAYRGASAQATSAISVPNMVGPEVVARTLNPYGKRPAFSYGGAGQLQRVTRRGNLWGLQAGYENLRSKVEIKQVYGPAGTDPAAEGHTNLTSSFLNTHAFFGHRFVLPAVELDLTAGPEVGFLLHAREQGEASYNHNERQVRTHTNWYAPVHADVRARVNLTAYYQRVGLSLGYSYGITNYFAGYLGGKNDLSTQVFRAGLVYRFGHTE